MPKTCACHGCTNRSSRLSNVSFHRFPHGDPALLLKWVTSISREDFQPTVNHSVCSDHFLQKDYLQGVHPRNGPKGMSYKLLAQAVPSVITSCEPLRRPRRQKNHQKQALPVKTQCPDDEKLAFQPPEVLNESNVRSAVSFDVQQQNLEVTEQMSLVHSPNMKSRNQFHAPSGVVKQEPMDCKERQSQVAARKVTIERASAKKMEHELKETKLKLRESRKEVNKLKQKLKRRNDALSKLLKALNDQEIISREAIVNHSVCSQHLLSEGCLHEVHLRDAEKEGSDELLAQAVEAHQQCEQKSRRKQTLPKKRQCPGDDDDAVFQPSEKINGSDGRSTASSHVQQQELEVTKQTLQVPIKEAQKRLELVAGEHGLPASSGVEEQQKSVVLEAHNVMRTLPELVSIDRCVYNNHHPKT